jgi:hypothetical protein
MPILEANATPWHACAANEGWWNCSSNLGARRWWLFNATLRPLYPQEIPGTNCMGGWMIPRAGLDEKKKSVPQDSILRPLRWPQYIYSISVVMFPVAAWSKS